MTIEELETKFESMEARYSAALERKAALGGELRAKKEELAKLVTEIEAAGYNPKTLRAERDKEMTRLEEMMTEFESSLSEAEEGLRAFDKTK